MKADRFVPTLLAALLSAGCGGDSSASDAPDADVRGTPFRRAKAPAHVPSGEMSLGDTDGAPAEDELPPPILVVAPPPPPAPAPARRLDEYKSVTFDDLAGFECAAYASEQEKTQVPESILALDGKPVAVDGYMMPLLYEKGGAKKFLLLRTQFGCCAAVTPKINEWIEVVMQGDEIASYVPHALVTVWGEFEVKEEKRSGMSVGLYRMKGVRTEFTEAK